MENRKTTLDREPISSEAIRGRQNFNQVLKGHQAMKPPLWKSAWFYGTVGLASLALIVAVTNMKPSSANDAVPTASIDKEVVHEANNQFFSKANTTMVSKKEKAKVVTVEPEISKAEEPVVESTVIETNTPSSGKDLNNEDSIIEEVPVVEVKLKEKKKFKTMPNIAGVFTGKLQIDDLCSAGGISCNNGFTVYSYDIQYYNGYGDVVERVNDDKFPPFLCNKLRTYNLNQEIMITNILAKNEKGFVERLISMRIEPTF